MIRYSNGLEGITVDQLNDFFEGWPNPPDALTHLRVLQGSAHVGIAWRDARLIGFITAISDGVLSAYIPLLEVVPDERGQGVGAELLRRMLAEIDVYMVDLMCDANRTAFYTRHGMRPAQGMIHRNYALQSGKPACS